MQNCYRDAITDFVICKDTINRAFSGFAYHCEQVVKAFNYSRHFGELLVEGVGDVVCGIRRDDEDVVSDVGHLYGQTAAVIEATHILGTFLKQQVTQSTNCNSLRNVTFNL